MMATLLSALHYAIILLSLIGIAIGRLPFLRMNRASIAFAGAALLIATGALGPAEAFAAIDLSTLILILSMMIITANLRLSGFFELAGSWVLHAAQGPRTLLLLVMATAALLSAFFLNDTICIMLPPLVVGVCLASRRNPIPYLIALAIAANIGSAATIIGNPQNMLIGAASGIPFVRFAARLSLPSLASVLVAWIIVVLCYPAEFGGRQRLQAPAASMAPRVYKPLLYKSLAAVALMLLCFLLNLPVSVGALAGAGLLLVTRRVHAERVFAELDWTIIAFFGGLFVITEAIARSGLFKLITDAGLPAIGQSMAKLSVFTVFLSNLVSNVPAVMLLRPLVGWFSDPERAWLVLALASTFAGNLTLLGSVANLIVAEGAKRYGVKISFLEYLKVGLPVTVLTSALGVAWLIWF